VRLLFHWLATEEKCYELSADVVGNPWKGEFLGCGLKVRFTSSNIGGVIFSFTAASLSVTISYSCVGPPHLFEKKSEYDLILS